MPDLRIIILFGITLVLTWLAIITYRQSRERLVFSFFALSVALWSLALGVFYAAESSGTVDFWGRMVYLFGSVVPVFFFEFSLVFTKKRIKELWHFLIFLPNIILGFYYFNTQAFIVQAFSDGAVRGYIYGYLKPLFDIHLGFFFLASFIVLYFGFLKAKDANLRLQFLYIILGTLTGLTVSLSTNVVFPWFGNFKYLWLGPLGAGIWAGVITYGISRHRLLNAKLIATQIFVGAIWLILFINITIFGSNSEFIFNISLFFISVFAGYLVVRSVIREVEQREQLERLSKELALVNEELKKLDQAKSEFISIASHQLRAPLTVIKGYVSMLLEDTYGKITEKGKKALKNVAISSEQLVKLIANMLDLSRIESGKIKYEFVKNNFEDVVAQVVQEFGPTAENRGIELVFEKSSMPLPEFAFDRDKIREVIVNFVDNALKYSLRGGRVFVREELAEKGSMKVLRFSVSDQGIGILPDEMEKLFTKFSRTKESQKIDPGGMGIGLYFVKRVVEDHLGKVGVESKGPGKGSTFWVELPIPPEMK